MSAVSDSTLGSAFSSMASSAGDRLRHVVPVPGPIAAIAGVEAAAAVVGDVASATVTLSSEALKSVGDAVGSAAGMVGRGIDDVENAASEAWNWTTDTVESAVTGAANLVVGTVKLPFTIAADVAHVATVFVEDGAELAGKAVGGVASFAGEAAGKLIDAVV